MQGILFDLAIKNKGKAKKIYQTILEAYGARPFSSAEWYIEIQSNLERLKSQEPEVQKAKILEDIQPDIEEIKRVIEESSGDYQKVIDFIYLKYTPIPRNNGNLRAKPTVSKLGPSKAIKKMIYYYHPDKIAQNNLKLKILSEEITKILTDLLEKI